MEEESQRAAAVVELHGEVDLLHPGGLQQEREGVLFGRDDRDPRQGQDIPRAGGEQ